MLSRRKSSSATLSAFAQTTLTFVQEVRKRPCIYDARHLHPDARKQAWYDIGATLFDEWSRFPQTKKEATAREMQQKWRSMRDCFAKAVRKEEADNAKGVPVRKRKRYIYFNELQFLLPHLARRIITPVLNDTNESSNSEDVKVPIDIEIENHSPENSQDTDMPPLQFVSVTPHEEPEENVISDTNKSVSMSSSAEKILSDLVALQKEDKDDPMGNKKFLLSLLPFMKKLPDDVNLEVRLQLLSVLKTYTTSRY